MKVRAPAESLLRAHGRGLLLSTLEKEALLSRIVLLGDGRFAVQTKDWDWYWDPVRQIGCKEAEDGLDALHSAWRDYIRSGFGSCQQREICFRYFSLLNVLLHDCRKGADTHSWGRGLQTALGFECFAISSEVSDSEVLGAGTCTLRNPCYLLAKLKMPNMPDDPQFLPLISVADTAKPELFYHYRQYALSADSPMSLLLFLRFLKRIALRASSCLTP